MFFFADRGELIDTENAFKIEPYMETEKKY